MVKRDVLPIQSNTLALSKGLRGYKKRVQEEYDEVMSVMKALFSLDDAVFIDIAGAIWLQEQGDKAVEKAPRSEADRVPLEPIPFESYVYLKKTHPSKKSNRARNDHFTKGSQTDLSQFIYPMNGAFWVLLSGRQTYKLMKWDKKPRGLYRIIYSSMNGMAYKTGNMTREYFRWPSDRVDYSTTPIDMKKAVKTGRWESTDLNANRAWEIREVHLETEGGRETKWAISELGKTTEKNYVGGEKKYEWDLTDASKFNLNSLATQNEHYKRTHQQWSRDRYTLTGFGFQDDYVVIPAGFITKMPKKTFRFTENTPSKDWMYDTKTERYSHMSNTPTVYSEILQFKQSYGLLNCRVL